MQLKEFLYRQTTAQRAVFALGCRTTVGHLQNVAYGYRTPSTELAVLIEQVSCGAVTRVEMFPGTFAEKWPELASVKRPHCPSNDVPCAASTEQR
jgi:hypothetical protein